MTDCWLIVWAGPGDWPLYVDNALKSIKSASDVAHYILSQEVEGDRWSLLLVHYAESERDVITNQLRRDWTYGFINAVADLGE